MPRTKTIYECNYCGKQFDNRDDCNQCEELHFISYLNADTSEIIKELENLGNNAYKYHIFNSVMGMPVFNFESLMKEAAKRLDRAAK